MPGVHSLRLLNYCESKCLVFENIILPLHKIPSTLSHKKFTQGNLPLVGQTGDHDEVVIDYLFANTPYSLHVVGFLVRY